MTPTVLAPVDEDDDRRQAAVAGAVIRYTSAEDLGGDRRPRLLRLSPSR
ncbi:hypothetical protein [Streptomyces sp. JV176]|nr:hypothetical protein [Streptomyces sp. JV176]